MKKILEALRKNKIGVAILTILLGAIGSGVWKYIIEPSLISFRDLLLNVTTLGMSAYKNLLYADIARGFTESSSLKLLSEFNWLYVTALVIAILWVFTTAKELKEKRADLLFRVDCLKKGKVKKQTEEEINTEIKDIARDIEKNSKMISSLLMPIFIAMAIFLISGKSMTTFREKYINSAIAHYEQSLKIAKPYMTSKEITKSESRFAQINNREDYISILNNIYQVLDKEGININKFDAW